MSNRTSQGPLRARAIMGATLVGLVLIVGAALPSYGFEQAWVEPVHVGGLVERIARAEAAVPDLRPGDGKGVVWAGEVGDRTSVAIAYLHGFSADRHEVEPLVGEVAEALGANAFFTRLAGHGRDGSAMAEATAEDWTKDAAEAVAVAERLGDRVVLMGTSTGAALALWAAARSETDGRLTALVLISPNLRPKDASSRLLLSPLGRRIARLVAGPERCFEPRNAQQQRHWTTCYPTSALYPMMALTETVRRSDLGRITEPTLVIYSPDDQVVDVAEIERMIPRLGSDVVGRGQFTGAEDPDQHVLAGAILSPLGTMSLRTTILDFLGGLEGG